MDNITYRKIFLFVGYWAFVFLGIYIGFSVYRYYSVIARGISGIALALLLYYFGKKIGLDDLPYEQLFLERNKYKNMFYVVVINVLLWFAFIQIYEMIRAL